MYPPVFAYVGERKGLGAWRVYVGETRGLRRKWKIENGKLEERSDAFNTQDTLCEGRSGQGDSAKEEGKAERRGMAKGGSGFGRGFGGRSWGRGLRGRWLRGRRGGSSVGRMLGRIFDGD